MVDFHLHSRYSDGTDTPAALCRKARQRGLRALALTDHDTTAGLAPFLNACRHEKLLGLTGIEMETASATGQLHLLGFHFDPVNPAFQAALEIQRKNRDERNKAILTRLSLDVIELDLEEIRNMFKISVIGRPHIAAMLVKKKKVGSVKEAFDRYLAADKPYYYSMRKMEFADAVSLIHAAGGVAVLAHPHSLKLDEEALTAFLVKLKDEGLDGIEAFHPDTTLSWSEFLLSAAAKLNLAITGGSDYHGKRKHRKIGTGPEKNPIDDRFFYSLTERIGAVSGRPLEIP